MCCLLLRCLAAWVVFLSVLQADDSQTVRVFIFAGQSNMEGADSKAADIANFPPFVGLDQPQPEVRFSYSLGRERQATSAGWVPLQPVNHMVGPELSFARRVTKHSEGPIAIIKCAAGGTHLGGDWNPDEPQGFEMYPRALRLVRESLAELDRQQVPYRVEGFMWHQGENDMFNEQYMQNYGKHLANFLACWRRDLGLPQLRFYVGELCTKTIWGMDLRPRMYAISLGQKSVTATDPHAEYVPTSHVGVEIGRPVGLHYHYGTLGQLQHGANYARAYLKSIGKSPRMRAGLKAWPYPKRTPVKLFVLAGHRNMEGERAFVAELKQQTPHLAADVASVAFQYRLGGGYRTSAGWESLGPTGYYETFGPELSFANALLAQGVRDFAIAKFTHSGSQLNDWTPAGSLAKSRHIYPSFVAFVRESRADLERRGHPVELAGIFYHLGENETSMPPYRKQMVSWLRQTIEASRRDLGQPELAWYVTQQPPTDHESVNAIDVTTELAELAEADPFLTHVKVFDLPPQPKRLVLNTAGILQLGARMAESYSPR